MVKVTDRAKVALKSALSHTVEEAGIGLKVEISEQCAGALYPDRMKAGDQVVEHEGNVLLLIGEEVSQPLGERRRRAPGWLSADSHRCFQARRRRE
jgi:hypothetical protein